MSPAPQDGSGVVIVQQQQKQQQPVHSVPFPATKKQKTEGVVKGKVPDDSYGMTSPDCSPPASSTPEANGNEPDLPSQEPEKFEKEEEKEKEDEKEDNEEEEEGEEGNDDEDKMESCDSVTMDGVVSRRGDGRLHLNGEWLYEVTPLGKVTMSMDPRPFRSSSENEKKQKGVPLQNQLQKLHFQHQQQQQGLMTLSKPDEGDFPKDKDLVWIGSFSMQNPGYEAKRKKRRNVKKTITVAERFFTRCKKEGNVLKMEGKGKNRFGGFTITGSVNLETGRFNAKKEYMAQDAPIDFENRLIGVRSPRPPPVSHVELETLRASKRQRVPVRMLAIDSSNRSYSYVPRVYGDGFSNPETMKRSIKELDRKDALYSDNLRDLRSLYDAPWDAEKAAQARKRAKSRAMMQFRQALKEGGLNPVMCSTTPSTTSSSSSSSSFLRSDASAEEEDHSGFTFPFFSVDDACEAPQAFRTGVNQIYEGEFDADGQRHGFGLCLFENGIIYEGSWAQGKMCGKGFVLNAYGELVYQGELSDNMFNGRGTHLFPNGDRFDGEFREGRMNGYGIYFHAESGGIYVGEWRRNKRHGSGRLTMPDSSFYDGEWMDDQFGGRGVLEVKGRCRYEGQFRKHRFEGRGRCVYEGNGMFYGSFKGGLKDGRGTYEFPNGAVYEGRFRNDAIEGFGTLKMRHDASERVSRQTWFLPIPDESEIRFIHQAAGFNVDGN